MRTETKLNIAVSAAVALLAAAFKLSAAPTANEDYVDAQDAQTYTNALRDANAYTDQKVAAAEPGNYQVVSNKAMTAVQAESDPTVPDWAKQPTKPSYTADEVGAVPSGESSSSFELKSGGGFFGGSKTSFSSSGVSHGMIPEMDSDIEDVDYLAWDWLKFSGIGLGSWINLNYLKSESDPTVPAWAKAPNPPAAMPNEGVVLTNGALRTKGGTSVTPAAIGAASAADVQTLNVGYTRLYNFSTGATNANFTATNYPPTQAEADQRCHWQPEPGMDFTTVPASLQLNEYRDGALRTVVDQRDWTTWYVKFKEAQLTNELARLRAENAALSNKLETAKAWANFTANGVENPLDDTVVVDRPNMWLMADYDWQKVVSGSNQCFVIHAKNVALSGGANTNGFLEVLDAFGKPYMRINKSSETFADPVFSEIYQDGNDGPWYIVFSNTTKPTKGGANLALRGTGTGKAIFYAEDDPECPAVITWPDVPESHAGHWIMRAQPKPVNGVIPSAMFFGAEIRVPGSDYVEYLKEASFGAGVRYGNNVYDYVESGDQLILRRRQ